MRTLNRDIDPTIQAITGTGPDRVMANGRQTSTRRNPIPALAEGQGTNNKKPLRKSSRILIADDHEAVRQGLRSALAGAGWSVCGEAVDGVDAIEKTAALKPDLVILDLSMPRLGGLDAARQILKESKGTKILVFTMHESKQIRDETVAIGVHGLAVKSAPLSTLLATIDSLLPRAHA